MSNTIIHGVFLNIFSVGVLLAGKAKSGKSELALTLITRNHQLIADDAPEFKQQQHKIIGSSPELLKNHLHIRDLGILNIKELYGREKIADEKELELIINLDGTDKSATKAILERKIPQINFNNSANREMTILIETAVLNFKLHQTGHDTTTEFNYKQLDFIRREQS